MPSNRSSLGGSNRTHSERGTRRVPHRYFLSLPPRIEIRVSCAPAAFLGSGSRFSGSLSGIEPRFPVTRYYHGGPLPHRRQLIGQKLVQRVAGAGPAIRRFAVVHPVSGTPVSRRSPGRFRFRRVRPSPRGFGPLARISPRLLRLSGRTNAEWIVTGLMSRSQFPPCTDVYLDLHGLVSETSIRLPSGSNGCLYGPPPRNPGAGRAFFSRVRAVLPGTGAF